MLGSAEVPAFARVGERVRCYIMLHEQRPHEHMTRPAL